MVLAILSLPRLLKSVRIRLMLWYLLVMALLLLAFCGILYTVVTQVALRNLEGNLRTMAQTFASTYERTHQFSATDWSADPLSKKLIVLVFSTHGDLVHAQGQLTPALMRQLQQALPAPGAMIDLRLSSAVAAGPADFRIFTEALPGPSQEILAVGSPRTDRQVVQYLLLGMGLAGPSILLLAAGGGYWLASRAMRPVRLMTQAVREIEETDLSRRIHLKSQDELGELAATFDQMLARLEAAFQRQRQFTADASHELRTPLSIITLAVNRGIAQCHTPEEFRQVLQTIHLENARMSQLVHDLLLLARTDGGLDRLRNEPVDLSDVALEVVARLLPFAEQCGIELVAGAFPMLWVNGDQPALASLISNLVENALKYTANVGTRVLVEGGCAIKEGMKRAWIGVEDNGPGIAHHHLPCLFERFYRANPARSAPQHVREESHDATGSVTSYGLGLAIVQLIAQAHHGEVYVQSEVGHGSRFEVWLPLLDHK